ncbi:MAG: VTT domain-containing protein [Candidatus Aenigmarchaeota archaeon]|nr:VTT domain-containing protein [Candidatus Aenigmarchaeota archaeon]
MVFSELVSGLIAWTFEFVRQFGALSVFMVVILEEILIPIPSPLVIMGASFILIPAGIPLPEAIAQIILLIVIPASVASTIGSFFTYGIGYYGGRPAINRLHRFLGMSWKDVEKQEKRLEQGKKIWTTIVIFRAIPFFPISLVSIAAGVLRVSRKKYAIATFIGSVPRIFVLGFMGWYFGSAYVGIASQFNILENILIIVVLGVLAFLLYRYRHHVKRHTARIATHVRKKSEEHYKKLKGPIS